MPTAPEPSRFCSSPVGMRTSRPTASARDPSRITVALARATRSPMPAAESFREELAGRAVAADRIRIAEVVHAEVAAGADAVDRRVREQRQPRAHDRHRQREIDAIGHPVGERARVLRDRRLDGVHRRDDVGAAAAGFRIVVGEHRRDVGQRHAVQVVVGEELIRVAERDLAAADGLAALGQDRAEAPRRSDERAGRRRRSGT